MEAFDSAARGWQSFYSLTGSAAATLAGLMFIAVTFGARLARKETLSTARAFTTPTYTHFMHVLLLSCLLTFPAMPGWILGAVLLFTGAGRMGMLVWIFRELRRAHRSRGDLELSDWLFSIAFPWLTFALIMAAGVGFILERSWAFGTIGTATIFLLLIGTQSAWELLIWVITEVNG